jgi:hypothetical protein
MQLSRRRSLNCDPQHMRAISIALESLAGGMSFEEIQHA